MSDDRLGASDDESFEGFHQRVERRLAIALAARYGPVVGREAALDALTWGWEHWEQLRRMENPTGYLYRVGQTRARRAVGRRGTEPAAVDVGTGGAASQPTGDQLVEPGLAGALDTLTVRQRQVVVLAHGYGCTHREIAELLGLSTSTVQNHAERGLAKLRDRLEARDHA